MSIYNIVFQCFFCWKKKKCVLLFSLLWPLWSNRSRCMDCIRPCCFRVYESRRLCPPICKCLSYNSCFCYFLTKHINCTVSYREMVFLFISICGILRWKPPSTNPLTNQTWHRHVNTRDLRCRQIIQETGPIFIRHFCSSNKSTISDVIIWKIQYYFFIRRTRSK